MRTAPCMFLHKVHRRTLTERRNRCSALEQNEVPFLLTVLFLGGWAVNLVCFFGHLRPRGLARRGQCATALGSFMFSCRHRFVFPSCPSMVANSIHVRLLLQ